MRSQDREKNQRRERYFSHLALPQPRWIDAVAEIPHPLALDRKQRIALHLLGGNVRQVGHLIWIVREIKEVRDVAFHIHHQFVVAVHQHAPFVFAAQAAFGIDGVGPVARLAGEQR